MMRQQRKRASQQRRNQHCHQSIFQNHTPMNLCPLPHGINTPDTGSRRATPDSRQQSFSMCYLPVPMTAFELSPLL